MENVVSQRNTEVKSIHLKTSFKTQMRMKPDHDHNQADHFALTTTVLKLEVPVA